MYTNDGDDESNINCNDSNITKTVHYTNNFNINNLTMNNFNNASIETSNVTNKFSKLLLGREMGPLKGSVFKRGILSEKVS
jgi:hypothetical protein